MCFYAYKNVLEPMGHLGANLIFSILTLNQVGGESQPLAAGRSVSVGTVQLKCEKPKAVYNTGEGKCNL